LSFLLNFDPSLPKLFLQVFKKCLLELFWSTIVAP